jgi:hypothetical protein
MSDARGHLAETILETMRQHLKLSIGVVGITRLGVGDVWRVDATAPDGERWAAEHEDYYTAACMLTELAGFELEGWLMSNPPRTAR